MTTQTTTRANWPSAVYSARTAHTAIKLYAGQPRLRRLAMAIRVACRSSTNVSWCRPPIDPSTVAMPYNAVEMESALSKLSPALIREFASGDWQGSNLIPWYGLEEVDAFLNDIIDRGN